MDPALAIEIGCLQESRLINEAIKRGDSEVQQFYKDATVLITGGSGFMGKQIVEKLFRACDIKKVFLLMRAKKKKTLQERMELILQDPVFDAVKKMSPGFEKRIYPIQGDVSEVQLGISVEDRAAVIEETEIIIHGAATVNFDEPLKVAVNTNVRGTVEMLKLGKLCKKLKSYVHVSTAFAHTTVSRINQEVYEKFYDAPLSPNTVIEMVSTLDDQRINDITPTLLGGEWPNTYTFTKAIAEEAVREEGSELPVSIVRPAIVMASHREPTPGWLDLSCAYGASGIILGCAMGVIHVLFSNDNIRIDLVPVDLVNNAIIAGAWVTAKRRSEGDFNPKIYTVTGMRNPLLWKQLVTDLVDQLAPKYNTPKALYYVFVWRIKNKLLYTLSIWLWHYIPAYIADVVLRLLGKRPIAVKIYTKIEKRSKVLSYFTCNHWISKDDNSQEMLSSMNPTDKQIFNCDMACFSWKEQVALCALGVRKYIIQDGLQDTEYGAKKQYWLKVLHYTVIAPLYFFMLYKIAVLALTFLFFALSCITDFLKF